MYSYRPATVGAHYHHVDGRAALAVATAADGMPLHVKRMSSLLEHASYDKKHAMVHVASASIICVQYVGFIVCDFCFTCYM